MILGYPPIAMPETLKKWKVVITLVGQGYESTKGRYDYKTSTRTTYGEQGQPMNIRKSNDNFKDGKPKCFKYDKKEHIAKTNTTITEMEETILTASINNRTLNTTNITQISEDF